MRHTVVRRAAACSAIAATVIAAGAFLPRGGRAAVPAIPRAAAADTAVFAGGCFWSMEKAFEHVPGVIEAVSGFSGGTVANPSYEDVGTRQTGHAEAVRVVFDPARVGYAQLLDVYWHNTDPISTNGQFCDHGPQYRTIVFVRDAAQRRAAEASKAAVQRHFTRPVTTRIQDAAPFYAAEAYHQNFAETHAAHYNAYRVGCGRDARLRELWGDAAGGQGH
ncbi:MAG TPA: peptide-methionine (S)-S-oxide reductase MsrA [Longimicrobium sp.]|nr:peptide-methionine (S)-S-oxide reductase MsrA [Longimicrobium sp.]